MTKPEKVLALVVTLAGVGFQIIRSGLSVDVKNVALAGFFSALWGICLFGCWLAFKAARAIHLEDIKTHNEYKPALHYVGDRPVRKTPSCWNAYTPAIVLCALFCFLIGFSIHYVPSKAGTTAKEEMIAIDHLSLRDLFRRDFAGSDRTSRIWYVNPQSGYPGFEFEYAILGSSMYNSKFLAYYLSATENTRGSCVWLAAHLDSIFNDGVRMSYTTKVPGDSGTRSAETEVFTGNVYIYHETYMPQDVTIDLTRLFAENKQTVIFRSIDYLYTKKLEMKLALSRR